MNFKNFFKEFKNTCQKHKKVIIKYFVLVILCIIFFIGYALRTKTETPDSSIENYVPQQVGIIENIEIPEIKDYNIGLMANHKYYYQQYGTFVYNLDYVGSYLGDTSSSFTLVEGDIYQYVEFSINNYEEGKKIYSYNSNDEFLNEHILLVEDTDNEAINGYWILSDVDLPNLYIPDFLKTNEEGEFINLPDSFIFYPTLNFEAPPIVIDPSDDIIEQYLSSLERIPSADSYYYTDSLQGIFAFEKSGIAYGNDFMYNTSLGLSYIVSVRYPGITYESTNLSIFVYILEDSEDETSSTTTS